MRLPCPAYEIYFPPLALNSGKVSQSYRFQGVCNCRFTFRLYLLSESDRRIKFKLTQNRLEFLDGSKIAVRLLENGKEVIDVEQAGLIFGGSGDLHYLSPGSNHLEFRFSRNAIYELQIAVKPEENPPVPIKIQFAVGFGFACPTKSCESIWWDDLVKNLTG